MLVMMMMMMTMISYSSCGFTATTYCCSYCVTKMWCIRMKSVLLLLCLLVSATARVGNLEDPYSSNVTITIDNVVFPEDWVVEDSGCRTPNGGVGDCIVFEQCQPAVEFLLSIPKPISVKDAETLRKYQCGFEGNNVKICCPDAPITSDPRPVNREKAPEPPDVSNHKNIKLINEDNCGIINQLNKILGGNKTHLFEFPWMALLSYRSGRTRSFHCGGTLINSKYILTAAHCLTNLKEKVFLGVRLGEHDIDTTTDCEDVEGVTVCSPPVQDYRYEEVIPHPEYSSTDYTNDIGLIRLQGEAVTEVDNVKPVCLPVPEPLRNYDFIDKNITVTGWGVTENGSTSSVLLQVLLPVIDQDTCKQIYKKSRIPLTYKQLCAGGREQRDSCGGDSGGPSQVIGLFAPGDSRYFQQGVVSFGPKRCGQEGFPGVYTRVAHYMDWILDNIRP